MSAKFQPTTVRPDNFDVFWADLLDTLKSLPVAPEEALIPLRSTDYCTTYAVRYTGLGAYRLFGYLSIPHGEGPFPTILNLPKYGSVLELVRQGDAVEKRKRYLVFSPAGRGQRNADRPYVAGFPGIFIDGIADPQRYIFRAFVADLCRGVDYLLTRPEVDRQRLAAISTTDLSLLVAALRPEITHLATDPTFFYATMDRAPQTNAYPLEEINDYLRFYPDRNAQVSRTLSYFDPLFFAARVNVPTLMWGRSNIIAPLADLVPGPIEVRASENSSYKDGLYQEQWLARQFGFAEPIIPAHWRL